MALLARHRRYWSVLFLVALLLGMASILAGPLTGLRASHGNLRPFPALPAKPAGWARLPAELWDYRQNFSQTLGPLARLDALLRYALRSPLSPRIAYGRDGWLLYLDEHALEQSLGALLRPAEIERLVTIAAAIKQDLAPDGGRLVVAIPPNSSSVNREHLPRWVNLEPATTEYDLLLAGLERKGVVAVDLRTLLREAARARPVYYATDTHWNRLGALIAYNAIMAALDRPEWQWDASRVLRQGAPRTSGDEARFLGMDGLLADPAFVIDLGDAAVRTTPIPIYDAPFRALGFETGRPGPVVAIIGNSFSDPFYPLLAPHVSRLVWAHHEFCAFDWDLIRSFHPAMVILMPTEREMPCPVGAWPKGLPER